jgi:hypothetical protein
VTDETAPPPDAASSLDELRTILNLPERQRITDLSGQVDDLGRRIEDRSALIATITPVMGDTIRQAIRENRQEMVEAITPVIGDTIRQAIQDNRQAMIEALYPIIGQLITRAVAEAMRDLARTIDARLRTSFDLKSLLRRLQARLGGMSEAELALREALPFQVSEVFVIHHPSGLLVRHISRDLAMEDNSDVISGMLTAIREFVQDAFGRGATEHLDEIQYGTRRILIEGAEHAYLAVVMEGIEPTGFRATLRETMMAFIGRNADVLADYDGDATRIATDGDQIIRSLLC